MDTDTITADNIETVLPTEPEHSYGNVTDDDLSWTNSDKWLTVTLGADEEIVGGETVNPTSAVKDADGRADATTAPGPAIPTPEVEEGIAWAWWHYMLIALGGLIVAGGLILLVMLMLRPKGPPEEGQPEEFEF